MSKQVNQSILIDARVKATLDGMDEVVSKLKRGLSEGTTKIDLTKGVGNSLSKNIERFKTEYDKFSKYIASGELQFGDSKEALHSGEQLIKAYRELKRVVGNFEDLSLPDAKKLFPSAFDSRIDELSSKLAGFQSNLSKLEAKKIDLSQARTELDNLREEADRLKGLLDKEATLKLESEKATKDLEDFNSEITAIREKAEKGISLKIKLEKESLDKALKEKMEIEGARLARKFNPEDYSKSGGAIKFKGKTAAQWKAAEEKGEATKRQTNAAIKAITLYSQEEASLKRITASVSEYQKKIESLEVSLAKIDKLSLSEAVRLSGGSEKEIQEANDAMRMQAEAARDATDASARYTAAQREAKNAAKGYRDTTVAIEEQEGKIKKLTLEVEQLGQKVDGTELKKAFSAVGIDDFSEEMLQSADGLAKLRTRLQELDKVRLGALKQSLREMGFKADQAEDYVDQLRTTLGGIRNEADEIKRSAQEIENLKQQVLDFFSVTNAVHLFKRALSSAFDTVKQLDATMTEAAVVTDFSIGDMWDKLPQYAQEADKLGTSINSLYAATTLYYQQGLKSNKAMALGVETMKMARIAGMESADATTAMTAALRGFNMTLDESSATRVNDVYSELAAITAADTAQIATAMTKTASIAASANMEFETTAALLAQIIETTQEAPETAGTAMKTIIARFTEVKELFSQGQLMGQDEEGEEININKIDAALKTVGISLKDFLNGTKGIDDIFLELASKWDSLDLGTQRYIATMAAGSRQQSRFIAMMSNYDRTMELVNAANTSAGASQRQFNKTLDSLDAKLEQLSAAWQQFLMGIANNEVIKDAIDLLTDLLKAVNKITTLGGKSSDAFSLVSKLGLTYAGMKGGKKVLDKALTTLISTFQGAGGEGAKNLIFGFNKKLSAMSITHQGLIDDLLGTKDAFGANKDIQLLSNNLTQLQEKYQLTDGQVAQFSNTIQQNGSISAEVSKVYSGQIDLLKKQRQAQLRSISTMIGAMVALYAVLALVQLIKKEVNKAIVTTEEKMDELKNQEEELTESTQKLSDELNNLVETKAGFKDMVSEIKNLKKGTAQWASTVHSVRTQMFEILDTYPELKKYTEVVNGVTVLTDAGWEEYERQMLENYYKNMQSLYGIKIQETELQKTTAAENLNVKTNTITTAEQDKIIKHQTYGGYIGGAAGAVGGWVAGTAIATAVSASAAKIGGAIGTAIAPGLGTAIGAVLGLAIGVGIGSLTGGSLSADSGISPTVLNDVALKAATYTTDKNTNFLAQEAVEQENGDAIITKFLEDSGLKEGTEDFQIMFDYISENAEEFDRHSQYLVEANAQLFEFGKQLGAITAEEKGYTGKEADTYEAISAIITRDEYQARYDNEYKKLVDFVTNQGIDVDAEGFTITDSALISEFLEAYSGFESRNGKIYYSGSDIEINNATFLGRLASSRVNLDIGERADDIFKLIQHDADTANLFKWVANKDNINFLGESGNANMAEIFNLISSGYNTLEALKKLPSQEELFWELFQQDWTAGTYKTSPIEYTWENLLTAQQSPSSRYRFSTRDGELSAFDKDGRKVVLNPNDYNSANEWINAHTSTVSGQKISWYGALNGGKATPLTPDQKTEVESRVASQNAWVRNNPLAWSLYWNPDLQPEFSNDLYNLVKQYDQLMQWTLKTGTLYATYDENGNRINGKVENGYGFSFLEKVDWASAKAFVEQFEKITSTYNIDEQLEGTGKTLADYFNTIAGTLTKDSQISQVMSLLANTDFTNLTELRATAQYLRTLNVPQATLDEFDLLIEQFKEAGIAIADIDLETLISQIKDTNKVIDKINDIEIGEQTIFSEEELNTMLSAGASRDDFYATTDGYVYLGDSMENLRSTLIETNGILLKMQVDALRGKIKTADAIEKAGLGKMSWGATSTWSDDTVDEVFSKILGIGSNAILDISQIDAAKAGTLLENIDSQTIFDIIRDDGGVSKLGNTVQAGIAELLAGWGDAFVNRSTYETQLGSGITDIAQQSLSVMTAEEILRADESEFNVYDENGQVTKDNIDLALDTKIQQEDLTKNYDDLTESLDWNDEALAKNSKLLKSHTVASDEANQATDKLNSIISDQVAVLKKGDKESTAYKKAISAITESAQGVFGEHIATDFVETNIGLFEDLAEGGDTAAAAWDKLSELSAGAFLEGLNLTSEQLSIVEAQMTTLDGMNLSLGGSAEFSAIFAQLAAVMGGAELAEQYIESLGNYEVTWVPNGETEMVMPDGSTKLIPNYIALVTGGNETGSGYNPIETGGGGDPEPWENPYDEFYETIQEINAELRERERLERKYQKLLRKTNTIGSELTGNREETLASLAAERETREWLKDQRINQVQRLEDENSQYKDLVYYDEDAGVIRMDWAAIQKYEGSTNNEEFLQGLTDYVGELEELVDMVYDEEEHIADIDETVSDIYDEGKDEYFELEKAIKDALVNERQKEIDELSAINSSINDTNSKLIDAMQSAIDKQRQERENQKTEEELGDMQRRLIYLRQDTSGANDLEILELEKELGEAQEDYTDSLIDQKISQLQEQNDRAAEQRQEQIDIAQAQLDHYVDTGEVWTDVYKLMQSGIDPATGMIIDGSALMKLLKADQEYLSLSTLGQMDWVESINDMAALAHQWLQTGNSIKGLVEKGEKSVGDSIDFKTADGKALTGTITEDGAVKVGDKIYSGVYRDQEGNFITKENESDGKPIQQPGPPKEPETPVLNENDKKGISAAIWNGGYGWGHDPERSKKLKELFGENDIQANYVNKRVMSGYTGKVSDYSYENMKKKYLVQLKTGGLVDFTGPAYLDGTKSKPEYVLSADQTRVFFNFVDILSSLSKLPVGSTSENSGDNSYDIDINVESIGSDYDVEQLANKIKSLINSDARYRNNSAVNTSR